MNERFLQFYEDELRHVREMAADFGALHPLVAGQLRIRKDGCDDPFVERLLEGFAFLSARIHEQIDQEFPVFTQSLLESIYPGLLCPTPSMGIVQLNASDSIGGKLEVPAGTELTGPLGDNSPSKCLFRTAHKVDLFPIDLINEGEEGVSYFDRDLNALNLPKSSQAESAIRLRINQLDDDSTFDEAEDIDELTFFVKGDLSAAGRIYEEIVSKTIELSVGELRKGKKTVYQTIELRGSDITVEPTGFSPEQALLPPDSRVFEGHRLLKEYATMPQRFLFFKIKGLAKYIKNVKGNALSIVLGLSKSSQDLSRLVAPDSLALNITPVINLFERRADQISVSNDQHEYRVHVNKTKPLDFEVYSVDEVTGLSAGSNYKQEFQPFYRDRAQQNNKHSFFSLRRRSRALTSSERQNGAVSKYRGAEILLSVVDGQNAPIHADVDALSIKVTCSNRHLPLNMPLRGAETDLIPDGGSGLTSIRWVLPPTNPTDSLTDLNGNWGLINHLSVNYLSLVDSEDGQATALKDLLRIYFNRRSEEGNEWIRGIERISSNPVVERHRGPGPITYVRGLQVDIFLDEYSFGGANAFLFGAVIARFLSYHTSINSFIKTNIHSSSRGLIMHWSGARGSKFIA